MDTEMVRLFHAAGERKEEISEGIIRRLKAKLIFNGCSVPRMIAHLKAT